MQSTIKKNERTVSKLRAGLIRPLTIPGGARGILGRVLEQFHVGCIVVVKTRESHQY